ncbi:hypothetical protein V4D00_12715 [Ralstonia solanacearum]|uniref:hypothetical protein n=1 Tax=Ralstonia solanacearum TaxID=305 RepID=UPI001FF98F1A
MARQRRKRSRINPQYRFLWEAAPWVLYGIGAFITLNVLDGLPCQMMRTLAANAQCSGALPREVWLIPLGCLVASIVVASWRFYRDYYCGEMFDDYDH